jgi:hypothetical protein
MSFSENPYTLMELITAPPKEVFRKLETRVQEYWIGRGLGAVDVYCNGCGSQDVSHGGVSISSPIILARQHFDRHIRMSHQRQPEDMLNWNWMV